jgi:type I restriction enzyme M protein
MATKNDEVIRNHAAFIWSVADLLQGDYKPYESGKVILPMVVRLARRGGHASASRP